MKCILVAAALLFPGWAWAKDIRSYEIPSIEAFRSTQTQALACLTSDSTKALLGSRYQQTAEYYAGFENEISAEALNTKRVALQKSYMAFRKLYKYCSKGELDKIGRKPFQRGQHDENSPFLGLAYDDAQKMAQMKDSRLLRLGNTLYNQNPVCPGQPGFVNKTNPAFLMIPLELKAKADAEADRLLLEKVQSKGLKSAAGLFGTGHVRSGVVMVSSLDNPWNDWQATAFVDEEGIEKEDGKKKFYTPAGVVKLHELHHIEQTLPGGPENNSPNPNEEALGELGCMIHQIVATDEVYKKAKGLPLAETAAYSADYPPGIKIGEMANFFRPLLKKYATVEQALMSPEASKFLDKYFPAPATCRENFPSNKIRNAEAVDGYPRPMQFDRTRPATSGGDGQAPATR